MITSKKIVLTGADSGIGLEVLKLLAGEKYPAENFAPEAFLKK